jgi:hypothetical protein
MNVGFGCCPFLSMASRSNELSAGIPAQTGIFTELAVIAYPDDAGQSSKMIGQLFWRQMSEVCS